MIKRLFINIFDLNFHNLKTFVVYFPYKNCKHSLISIDFIPPVYELFDNFLYSELNYIFSVEMLVYFFLRLVQEI